MQVIERHFKAPEGSFFIFGPRGTGKSTWLQQHYQDAYWINLLDDATYRQYLSHPEHLLEVVHANRTQQTFVIDEIQKVPPLLDIVHLLIEEKQGWQFILTGSSARKLRREGVNLLAGRAIRTTFHPFLASELGSSFDLKKALTFGMIPLIYQSDTPRQTLETYLALYMKEEVQSEALVRRMDHFSRFLEVMSFSHGSLLNLSEIARECQISRKLVENYLSILEDLLIAYQLPVFRKRAKRQLMSHQKFYYFDSGLFYALRPRGALDRPEEVGGISLEGLIGQHLKAWSEWCDKSPQIYFWRTRSGLEVDFVVYGEEHFCAIEVKHSQVIHSKDLRSLKEFYSDYPECTPYLLYLGKERSLVDGIHCVPANEFLLQLKPNMPIISLS